MIATSLIKSTNYDLTDLKEFEDFLIEIPSHEKKVEESLQLMESTRKLVKKNN